MALGHRFGGAAAGILIAATQTDRVLADCHKLRRRWLVIAVDSLSRDLNRWMKGLKT